MRFPVDAPNLMFITGSDPAAVPAMEDGRTLPGRRSCSAHACRDDEVVCGVDAEATELHRDGRGEITGRLERVDRLEGVAAVAVVLGRVAGKLPGELCGDRYEAGAGVRIGFEFDGHGDPRAQSVVRFSATGTPLVTMS